MGRSGSLELSRSRHEEEEEEEDEDMLVDYDKGFLPVTRPPVGTSFSGRKTRQSYYIHEEVAIRPIRNSRSFRMFAASTDLPFRFRSFLSLFLSLCLLPRAEIVVELYVAVLSKVTWLKI